MQLSMYNHPHLLRTTDHSVVCSSSDPYSLNMFESTPYQFMRQKKIHKFQWTE